MFATSPTRPNIVVILADDLGYGDLSCYNATSKIPTPNLDQLAREGVRATDAHAPASVCSPTRYAMLTGRYAWRGILKNGVVAPWGKSILERDRLNVALLLRGHGYTTACFGKWHLGWSWATKDGAPPKGVNAGPTNVDLTKRIMEGPTERGFDDYFGVDLPNFPPYCFIENDRTVGVPTRHTEKEGQINRPGPILDGWKLEDILPEVGRRAVSWLEKASKSPEKPFFLYLPLTSPHFPIVPSKEWQGKTKVGAYGDFVAQTDAVVGDVLAALKRLGVEKNTLVIFTSDNGPEVAGEVGIGAYERIGTFGHDSRGGLRGVKRDMWEGGHRVPFLARWPGKIRSGSVCKETICHVDLMATLAGVLGAELPENAAEDSVDMLPALQGKPGMRRNTPTVHQAASGKFAIRKGDWVFINAPSGNDNGKGEPESLRPSPPHGQPGELFHLKADPAERVNRYAEQPSRVLELKALLERAKSAGRTVPPYPKKRKELGVGARPIPGAEILIDGTRKTLDEKWTYWQGPRFRSSLPIKWPVVQDSIDGGMCVQTDDPAAAGGVYGAADIVTKQTYRDFRLHIEFWIARQGGNSGVYLQNRYEIQICDGDRTTHGLGAVINEQPAPYHAYHGLGKWNAYDIVFRAARFKDSKLIEKAHTTIYLNGQKAHTDVPIQQVWGGAASGVDGGNDSGRGITDTPQGLKLQCEGHDVRYRNAWIKPLSLDKVSTDF
ncbi:sulfatase-like hydrolase/transferase [Armatimonas sp.]|uniref:sulfatase-like hydrolase/transferase n=1 Tax=Armatimonas sp. TaxID=1872638 RepID=UPI00286BF483|nr:sulfatase-like hydrolase/transferase [Armatimonas sp.]